MAASDETKAGDPETPSGPVIDNEPAPARSPFMRKLRLYGILALVVVIAALIGAGTYPYWRADAEAAVAKVGLELETVEQWLGIPEWAITHGRARPVEAAPTAPALSAQSAAPSATPSTTLAETAASKPDPAPSAEPEKPVIETQPVAASLSAAPSSKVESATEAASTTTVSTGAEPSTTETATTETSATNASDAGPAPAEPASRDDVEGLRAEVAALQARLAEMENRLADAERAAAEAADIAAAAVSAVDRTVRTAETGAASTGDSASVSQPPVSAALLARLDGLAERLDHVETQQSETARKVEDTTPAAESAALLGTVVGLAERLATIESRTPVDPSDIATIREEAIANAGQVADLKERLQAIGAKLEEGTPDRDRAALVLLSVGQLAVATTGARPFAAQLEALRSVAGEAAVLAEPINRLEAHAEAGAPTLTMLKASFTRAASAAVRGRDVGAPDGVLGQTLSRVASLVTVRKIDAPGAGTVDGALAAAEAALAVGDLAAALAALAPLEGAPAAAVGPWRSGAEARLAVDGAVSDLQAAVLAQLAAAG